MPDNDHLFQEEDLLREEQPHSKLQQDLQAFYQWKPEERQAYQRVRERLMQTTRLGRLAAERLTSTSVVRGAGKRSLDTGASLAKSHASTRLLLVTTTLIVSLLVGGLLMVLNMAHLNHTDRQPINTTSLYFSRSNVVSRLDAQTRKVLWQTPIANQSEALLAHQSVGAPTVIGDTVYVASGKTLFALAAQTGKVRWSHTFPQYPRWPFEDDGKLYVKEYTPFSATALDTINQTDGTIIATYTPSALGQTTWHDPLVVKSVLYSQDAFGSRVYAIHLPDKKLLWQIPISQKLVTSDIFVQDGVVSIVDQQMVRGSSTNEGIVETFDASNGSRLWQLPAIGSPVRIVTTVNDQIYVGSVSSGLLAFNIRTHKLVWQSPYNPEEIQVFSNTLCLSYSDASGVGQGLAAVDVASGRTIWQQANDRNGGGGGVQAIGVSAGIFYGIGWTNDGKKGTIYALNVNNGSLLWTMPTSAEYVQWGGITLAS